MSTNTAYADFFAADRERRRQENRAKVYGETRPYRDLIEACRADGEDHSIDEGCIVKGGHTNWCAEHGHAEDFEGRCARCGDTLAVESEVVEYSTETPAYGLVWVDSIRMTETPQDVPALPLADAKARTREYNRLGRTATGWYETARA